MQRLNFISLVHFVWYLWKKTNGATWRSSLQTYRNWQLEKINRLTFRRVAISNRIDSDTTVNHTIAVLLTVKQGVTKKMSLRR